MNWSKEELQQIMFMTRSWARFQDFIKVSNEELEAIKKLPIQDPRAFVKGMHPDILMNLVVEKGSFDRAAAIYGVSGSFLKQVLRKAREPFLRPRLYSTEGRISQLMERYLSVRLTARIMQYNCAGDWNESKVRKIAKKEGFDLKRCIDGHDTDYNNSFGRKAERAFAEIRGAFITADCNKEEGPNAPFDFWDEVYHRVNVKASRAHRTKATKSNFWKFSAAGLDVANYAALMLYDKVGDKLLYWTVADAIPLRGLSTITIDESVFEQWGMTKHNEVLSSEISTGPERLSV